MPLFVVLFFPSDAHAYLDPGTGSIIIQAIVASTAAVLYAVNIYWHKIKTFFKKRK
jgi:hypothetical protein